MFHFDVVKSLLFFISLATIYVYSSRHLKLDFSVFYSRPRLPCNLIGAYCTSKMGYVYEIIAYGWLEFVWKHEWFIIRRDT